MASDLMNGLDVKSSSWTIAQSDPNNDVLQYAGK
jgi:hypothetical protein